MWPSLKVASTLFDAASVALVASLAVGVAATALIVWMGYVKEHHWDALREASRERTELLATETARANAETARAHERIAASQVEISQANERAAEAIQKAEEEKLARIRIEARIAPRSMTQQQQNELTAKLAVLATQRGTIVASPSTPESEMFARVLAAPLRAAGWDFTVSPGTSTATVLFPTGILVHYDAGNTDRIEESEATSSGIAALALASYLNGIGVAATALPLPAALMGGKTIQVVISAK